MTRPASDHARSAPSAAHTRPAVAASCGAPGILEVYPRLFTVACSLPPAQRYLLLALATHGGPNSRGIFPSVQCLADETGFCRRTVQTHLRQMEQDGVVLVHRRPQQSHLFELRLDPTPERAAVPPATPRSERHFSLEEVREALAFVLAAGTDTTLQLDPALLDSPSPCAEPASPEQARAQPLRPLPPEPAEQSAALVPPLPVAEQPLPPGEQALHGGGAAAAPELLQKNLSREQEQTRGGEGPAAVECVVAEPPEAAKVGELWGQAWSGRYGGSYTAERGDGARLAFLATTARDKALTRQSQLRARGEAECELGELARQYLGHLFDAYLSEPGQPTREGTPFLRWKKHPLRYLEQDLARLGDPWSKPQRQRASQSSSAAAGASSAGPTPPVSRPWSAPGNPSSGVGPSPAAARPPVRSAGQPRLVVAAEAAPIPAESMARLGELLGRRPPELASVRPARTAAEVREALGPGASEAEVEALVKAEQQRWAWQQRRAKTGAA